MQILVNEFSLDGSFSSVDGFLTSLINVIKIEKILVDASIQLLKHYELYNQKVTGQHTLNDVLTDPSLRTTSEVRRFKILLAKIINDPPFWNEDQIHSQNDRYVCSYTSETHGYSLAEACERDKYVLSFDHDSFREVNLEVRKNGELIRLFNIVDPNDLVELIYELEIISPYKYCYHKFQGTKLSFDYFEAEYGFDNMEQDEIKSFISSFELFSSMDWSQIIASDGFDYKQYRPSKDKNWFRNSKFQSVRIDKFRASQRYRCFGFRQDDVFFVLRLETDHKNSDHG